MRLSAPIHVLKQRAKAQARQDKIRLHLALDRIAVQEGFQAWSHLASHWASASIQPVPATTPSDLFAQLQAGDLVLIGARPHQGKTLLALGLAVHALQQGQSAAFFSLEFTQADVARGFAALGHAVADFGERLLIDVSDQISADHIAARLAATPPRTLVVVDYLQLLDQKREHPPLDDQVRTLKALAQTRQAIVVCLSQIRRDYEPARQPCPALADVRLPNPLDLSLFDKACLLHDGRMQLLMGH